MNAIIEKYSEQANLCAIQANHGLKGVAIQANQTQNTVVHLLV